LSGNRQDAKCAKACDEWGDCLHGFIGVD
jgi:hypothetical protein